MSHSSVCGARAGVRNGDNSGVAGDLCSSVLHCCEAVAGPVHSVAALAFCREQTCVLLNSRD